MPKVSLALNAMATRFEFVLAGENPVALRAAGEEALEEVRRVESQLSLYQPGSEIAQVNARAAFEPVRVSPAVFGLLEKARRFHELSGGAFDITIAPLVRCWGFMKGSGARPGDEEIAAAKALVGTPLLELDPAQSTVRFAQAGVMIDLGSIGKGYAIDLAAEILRDAGVENALLHGGTSTIYALGFDPETGPWKVAIDRPATPSQPEPAPEPLTVIHLSDQAMSVSAVWGKFFVLEGKTYGHVLDPRTGWPAAETLLGCVVIDNAADSDALSTAVLLASEPQLGQLSQRIPELRYLQVRMAGNDMRILARGIESIESN